MRTYKDAKFKDVETGRTFITSIVSMNLLERIKDGKIEIVEIIERKYPETLSALEMDILIAVKKGEKIPPSLKKYLESAQRKQKENIEWQERLKTYGEQAKIREEVLKRK